MVTRRCYRCGFTMFNRASGASVSTFIAVAFHFVPGFACDFSELKDAVTEKTRGRPLSARWPGGGVSLCFRGWSPTPSFLASTVGKKEKDGKKGRKRRRREESEKERRRGGPRGVARPLQGQDAVLVWDGSWHTDPERQPNFRVAFQREIGCSGSTMLTPPLRCAALIPLAGWRHPDERQLHFASVSRGDIRNRERGNKVPGPPLPHVASPDANHVLSPESLRLEGTHPVVALTWPLAEACPAL